jgi:predicted SPOUT superfamily RNA methylase MTH1
MKRSQEIENSARKEYKKTYREPKSSHELISGEQSIEEKWAQKLTPAELKRNGRKVEYTVSVAIPGSMLRNAQTRELKTYLVGQIARACAIHEIDEIIVFVDTAYEMAGNPGKGPTLFFSRLLQYLECPSYLRKALFPVHQDLSFAGLLPPLDMPHHMSRVDVSLFREGVVADKPVKDGSLINIGLTTEAVIEHKIKPGVRVTVKLAPSSLTDSSFYQSGHANSSSSSSSRRPQGEAVAPASVRQQYGLYWGYQTRLAKSFSEVFSGCPYTDSDTEGGGVGGYDYLIGNSPGGPRSLDEPGFNLSAFRHLLIVFGGAGGIEASVDADESLATSARNTASLFDLWADLAPTRGSRAMRTEEAVLAGLARLIPHIEKQGNSTKIVTSTAGDDV